MARWIGAADIRRRFDLVIANAGITTGLRPDELYEDPEAARAVLSANLFGVLNTVEPLFEPMLARGGGQIAIIGSIAGLRGLPYSPAYCAAKAGVHAWSELLRGRLEPAGVSVSLVIPGFVKTPLNDSIERPSRSRSATRRRRGSSARPRSPPAPSSPFPGRSISPRGCREVLPPWLVDAILSRFEVKAPRTRERTS